MSRYCVRCSVRAESMLSQVGLVLIMQGREEESRGRKEVWASGLFGESQGRKRGGRADWAFLLGLANHRNVLAESYSVVTSDIIAYWHIAGGVGRGEELIG